MNNWTLDVKKRRRCNCQKKHFDQLIAILVSECVLFFDEQIVFFKISNCFYQFSNFVLKKWKTKKEMKSDKKSKNVFINSAILLFLFKPLPLFFMLLNSQTTMIIFQFLNPGWSLGISLLYLVVFPYFFGIIFHQIFCENYTKMKVIFALFIKLNFYF